MRARAATIELSKAFKHVRQKLCWDSLPGIADRDLDVRINACQSHLNSTAFGREFHRVREQVPSNLLKTIWIPRHWTGSRINHRFQADFTRLGDRLNNVDGCFDDRRQID